MTTGQRIRAARKQAGLTQRELGKRLGISYQSVAQWENDLRNPKLETLNRIAQALEVEALELVAEDRQEAYAAAYLQYVRESRAAGEGFVPEWSGPAPAAEDAQRGNLLFAYDHLLNPAGRREAVKRLWELALLPQYRRKPAGSGAAPAPAEAPADREEWEEQAL